MNAGIIPADITSEGKIGLVSKSGTLTYQVMYELRDIGFSTAVGIGGGNRAALGQDATAGRQPRCAIRVRRRRL